MWALHSIVSKLTLSVTTSGVVSIAKQEKGGICNEIAQVLSEKAEEGMHVLKWYYCL